MRRDLLPALKSTVRALLFHSGLWSLWHRIRNRHHLTVFMFHRVLPAGSASLAGSESEYTFSLPGFERCLDFILKHYNVVTLAQLAQPRTLPRCPALITFDDGWQDTLLHAGPALQARGLPAVVFAVPSAIADARSRWWADALVSALSDDRKRAQLQQVLGLAKLDLHQCHAILAAMPVERLWTMGVLDPQVPGGGRQMLTEAQLILLNASGIEVGAHGHSHAPLTHADDAEAELRQSSDWLAARTTGALSMAFPHGAWNLELARQAHDAGFRWVFNSVTGVVPVPRGPGTDWPLALGRIHVPENVWTCDPSGRVSWPKLAAFLFSRRSLT